MPLTLTLTCDDCDTTLTVPGVTPGEIEAVIFANHWQHNRSIGTRCPACAAAEDQASNPENDWPDGEGAFVGGRWYPASGSGDGTLELDPALARQQAMEALDAVLAQAVTEGVAGYVMCAGQLAPLSVADLLHGGAMDMAALAAHAAKGDTP